MAAYFEACLEEAGGDAAFIAKALGDIARAKGMSQVASDAGLSRESLYKALSGERIPNFDTICDHRFKNHPKSPIEKSTTRVLMRNCP
jgi:probable addiction module antidote protein